MEKKMQTVSIFDLMNKLSWQEYIDHIKNCPDCSDPREKFKMCPTCYYIVESARPYISNDQMKLIALGELEIVTYITKE